MDVNPQCPDKRIKTKISKKTLKKQKSKKQLNLI